MECMCSYACVGTSAIQRAARSTGRKLSADQPATSCVQSCQLTLLCYVSVLPLVALRRCLGPRCPHVLEATQRSKAAAHRSTARLRCVVWCCRTLPWPWCTAALLPQIGSAAPRSLRCARCFLHLVVTSTAGPAKCWQHTAACRVMRFGSVR